MDAVLLESTGLYWLYMETDAEGNSVVTDLLQNQINSPGESLNCGKGIELGEAGLKTHFNG
jgi:hypothetical protein